MRNHYERLIQQGKLPNLKIVGIGQVLLHEHHEARRVLKLRDRIALSGIIENPVICTHIPDSGKYLLLDGAHRFEALRNLECRFIPAQIVAYDDPLLRLKRWRHLFHISDETEMIRACEEIPDAVCSFREGEEAERFRRITKNFYAQVILRSGKSVVVRGPDDLSAKIRAVNRLASVYKSDGLIDRISYDDLESLTTHYHDFTGLIVYPSFSKEEIVRIAVNSEKLPTGITRHVIPKRALHLHLPLSVLRFTEHQEEVDKFLLDFINQRIKNQSIRFYSESIFFFDD